MDRREALRGMGFSLIGTIAAVTCENGVAVESANAGDRIKVVLDGTDHWTTSDCKVFDGNGERLPWLVQSVHIGYEVENGPMVVIRFHEKDAEGKLVLSPHGALVRQEFRGGVIA